MFLITRRVSTAMRVGGSRQRAPALSGDGDDATRGEGAEEKDRGVAPSTPTKNVLFVCRRETQYFYLFAMAVQ